MIVQSRRCLGVQAPHVLCCSTGCLAVSVRLASFDGYGATPAHLKLCSFACSCAFQWAPCHQHTQLARAPHGGAKRWPAQSHPCLFGPLAARTWGDHIRLGASCSTSELSIAPCPLQLFRLQSVLREAGIQVFGGKLTTRVLGLPAAPSNRYPHSCCAACRPASTPGLYQSLAKSAEAVW